MGIKITRANDVILINNLIICIYGGPGLGKTSMGFSSSKPLLLDFDQGAQRSIGRKDAVVIKSWADIENLIADDLAPYDTLILDTVGRCLEVLSQFLGVRDPKLMKRTGELTIAGYGALYTAFKAFLSKVKSFGKDIILIGHSKEDKENEITCTRIDAIGSSKDEITKCSDLLGYVFAKDSQIFIDFNPTNTHLGKNCAAIKAQQVPDYVSNKVFMAELITQAKNHMNAKSEAQIKAEDELNAGIDVIDGATSVDDFNKLLEIESFQKNYVLKQHLHKRAIANNLEYDKEDKCYKNKAA